MEYRLVTHYGSGFVRHVLDKDTMVVDYEKTGRHEVVPYSDITEINLRHELQGAWSTRVARSSGSALTIPARHFEALGKFEDRGPEYVAFIEQLHRNAHASNPTIRFVSGSSLLYVLGWFFVLSGALFLAVIGYALLFSPKPIPRRVLPIIPVALVVGAMFIRQGRARSYPPDQLPAKMLPPLTR